LIGQLLLYRSALLISDPLLTKDGTHLVMGWANNMEGESGEIRTGVDLEKIKRNDYKTGFI